jgi:hypothetical protein
MSESVATRRRGDGEHAGVPLRRRGYWEPRRVCRTGNPGGCVELGTPGGCVGLGTPEGVSDWEPREVCRRRAEDP